MRDRNAPLTAEDTGLLAWEKMCGLLPATVQDRSSGRVLQTVALPAVFLGIAFSPDGRALYVSGGNEDAIYRFDWRVVLDRSR